MVPRAMMRLQKRIVKTEIFKFSKICRLLNMVRKNRHFRRADFVLFKVIALAQLLNWACS